MEELSCPESLHFTRSMKSASQRRNAFTITTAHALQVGTFRRVSAWAVLEATDFAKSVLG
jgi:hypothetical protein